ncbi:MAG: universal stress protein [Microbacteriaceae bacterium]|nr:universal stress protein [Microbacteriaceae bacterium]MCL2794774.1 universal stress protein [Microbacteriaceae bacterium]
MVGIAVSTSDRVLDEAVAIARDLGKPLACVYVDESRVPIGEAPDGTVITAPVASNAMNSAAGVDQVAGSPLTAHVVARAAEAGVSLAFHTLAGDPATAIARFAVDHDARLIVVGTRRPGVRASLSLLISGPVSSRLARRQPVPVLVVPLHDRVPVPGASDEHEPGHRAADATDIPSPEDILFGEGHA